MCLRANHPRAVHVPTCVKPALWQGNASRNPYLMDQSRVFGDPAAVPCAGRTCAYINLRCDIINYLNHIYGNRSGKLPYCSIPLPTPEIPLPTSAFDINQPIDLKDNCVVKGALFASEKTFSSAGREPGWMTICAGASRFSANWVVDEIGDQAERPLGVRRGRIPGDEGVRLAFETVKRDRAA